MQKEEMMILLVLTTLIPMVAYWIAFKKGKFWAQVVIGLVSLVIPDVLPLIDEMVMNGISFAGFVNRNLLPRLMKLFIWVIGVVFILSIIVGIVMMCSE